MTVRIYELIKHLQKYKETAWQEKNKTERRVKENVYHDEYDKGAMMMAVRAELGQEFPRELEEVCPSFHEEEMETDDYEEIGVGETASITGSNRSAAQHSPEIVSTLNTLNMLLQNPEMQKNPTAMATMLSVLQKHMS